MQDYRLGIPHLLFTVLIVIYIFVYTLIYQGGYLEYEQSITGSGIRSSFRIAAIFPPCCVG
eukprot:SAG31_NODE_32423_length_356_cov_0.747082_1_plen_61_part_00